MKYAVCVLYEFQHAPELSTCWLYSKIRNVCHGHSLMEYVF
jgi:hypothetical protein